MKDLLNAESSSFNGIYKELVEIIGHENTLLLYENFKGQHVVFPKKLLTNEFIQIELSKEYNGNNANELARKYGYTYSWVMKQLRDFKKD